MRIFLLPLLLFTGILGYFSVGHSQGPINLNPYFHSGPGANPKDYELVGNVIYSDLGSIQKENSGWGVRLLSNPALGNKIASGKISTGLLTVDPKQGRWYRISIRALAQNDFHVERDDIYLQAEFFKDKGKTSLDQVKKRFYLQIELDRKSLPDPGTNEKLGSLTWRVYSFDFRIPFSEVDTLRVSAGFENGVGKGYQSEFWINHFEVERIGEPADFAKKNGPPESKASLNQMIPLGGRWYFDPKGGSKTLPRQFDHSNADQLVYQSDKFIAPFLGNTTSWLRKGYLNREGNSVGQDRFVEDNVILQIEGKRLMVRSKNLPNHPTAIFPDRWRALDGNPNFIQEQNFSWRIPLEPTENPNRVAMKNKNNNDYALPMGPIGIACNGVIFFNPFDHLQNEDAVWRLDRCCGHPAQRGQYHYHKYPVCIKSPWTDDGDSHSPVIGFAFDGYPVYGPYESKGILARDSNSNPLNEFNVHKDDIRGWHYHVTPGMFPHIIGGYWGSPDEENRQKGGPKGDGKGKKGFPPKGDKKGPPKK